MRDAYRNFRRFVARSTGILPLLQRQENQGRQLADLVQLVVQVQTMMQEREHAQAERLEQIAQKANVLSEKVDRLSEGALSLQRYASLPLPVYLGENGLPSAAAAKGPSPHRVVVCSIPKSGTYLIAEVLQRMGLVSSGLHLRAAGVTDYRFASIQQMREDYMRWDSRLPLADSAQLIRPGQFAAGHVEHNDYTKSILHPFKKVFVFRELRDCLVSWLRFLQDTGRTGRAEDDWKRLPEGPEKMLRFLDALGEKFFVQCHPNWLDEPEVFAVSFESLYGDYGRDRQVEVLRKLHAFLDLPGKPAAPEQWIDQALERPTKTWSGQRSRRDMYWNDEVEARFGELGGRRLNARLGYPEEENDPLPTARRVA